MTRTPRPPRTKHPQTRGADGRIIMKFMDFCDDGGAAEVFVTHIGQVSARRDVIRVTFVNSPDDVRDRRAVVHLIIDLDDWTNAIMAAAETLQMIKAEPGYARRHEGRNKEAN